eukprot:CAMPEP_0171920786 /NCGR_PEP_ID=MMETSP0993-20121228/19555_1 /TAXON_ID=483369 /ORGANISM="non described non described, Strain CCMP2098" /LENGTH=736 /DNA_ID=CAMNT_0012557923 /DNA_START=9 /DNA_END=2215 /DNA_ORIENTATION=+
MVATRLFWLAPLASLVLNVDAYSLSSRNGGWRGNLVCGLGLGRSRLRIPSNAAHDCLTSESRVDLSSVRSQRPYSRDVALFAASTTSHATTQPPPSPDNGEDDSRIRKLAFRQMAAYLWPKGDRRTKSLLMASLSFLFVGKLLNAQVPFILQRAVDSSGSTLPLGLFFLYGMSRVATVAFNELKTATFAHVSQRALRRFSNSIFSHLHVLDASFHNANPSGLLSVAYVRGVRGFQAVLFQLVFAVVPTILELGITAAVLTRRCGPKYALATLATFVSYCAFTSGMTEWRMRIRRKLVAVDNDRNAYFVDAMANSETVKLFANEKHELNRFDGYLGQIQALNIQNTYAIAVLNVGQAVIFSAGLTAVMLFTAIEVKAGLMSIGNIVAVNGLLLQLQQPFNFIGYTYQEIRQGFVDMRFMLELLQRSPEVTDKVGHAKLRRDLAAQEGVQKLVERESRSRRSNDDATAAGGEQQQQQHRPRGVVSRLLGKLFGVAVDGGGQGGVGALKDLQRRMFQEPDYAADAFLSNWLQKSEEEAAAAGVAGASKRRGEPSVSEPEPEPEVDVFVLPEARGEVEFRQVSFSYESSASETAVDGENGGSTIAASAGKEGPAGGGVGLGAALKAPIQQLRNVSFTVKAGETVALVGSSGSGKSTCLKLITRLHDASEGCVLVDGVDVKAWPLAEVRQRVGVVTQDTTLFDNTVAYNIRYGDLRASDEQVVEAAKQAHVHDSIAAMEGG